MSENTSATGSAVNPEVESSDPFNLAVLRRRPLAPVPTTKPLITVPVRKPKKHEFFRVHPDPDHRIDCYLVESEEGRERVMYWVHPMLGEEALQAGEAIHVRLFTCVSRHEVIFLWPARLPVEGAALRWHTTALEIAEAAQRTWLKLIANPAQGAYEYLAATADLGAPPWPTEDFEKLIRIAFQGRIIDAWDHELLLRRRGAL